jgi:membrane-bound lytic murein transglycosylase B
MEFRAEAAREGVSERTLDAVFKNFSPLERVVELDRKQPEGTHSFTQYLGSVVSGLRIRDGQANYRTHKALLDKISARYGVPANVIVALWGIETSYGKVTGSFNVPQALATLAYEGRRADFFRKELMNALKIIEQGHVMAASMEGSWAGAMGQSQFMPSSFLSFAVDANGDGRRDIWSTQEDVFASIANYLSQSGWNAQEGWGEKVQLPKGFDRGLEHIDQLRPRREWAALGITRTGGGALPADDLGAALVFPGEPDEGAYLVTSNYHVILKWNRSRYFATAVGILADKVK